MPDRVELQLACSFDCPKCDYTNYMQGRRSDIIVVSCGNCKTDFNTQYAIPDLRLYDDCN